MAEILPNSPNDVASRGVTNATLAQFKGLARQVVINIDDGFRPVSFLLEATDEEADVFEWLNVILL